MVVVRRKYQRPEKIKRYTKQVQFMDAPERYTVVEATTKAGKTTGCIVWLFEQAYSPYSSFYVDAEGKLQTGFPAVANKDGYNYWWVAPVHSQAKIAFNRMKRFISKKTIFTSNESEQSITLENGAKIWFKSGEKPDNLYGDDVHAVVLDEATRMRKDAWHAIRSTLTATKGRVKIIGNVKGIENWVYELARKAEAGAKADWAYFKLTAQDAVDAGVLDAAEIEDARATLPKAVFLELYYAIPNMQSEDRFAYSFDPAVHVKTCKIDFDYPVHLSFDFNKNPICCTIIQYIDGIIKIPHCVKLQNSNITKLCAKLNAMLLQPDGSLPRIIVNGDATGNYGNALTGDRKTYFTTIRKFFRLNRGQMKQGRSNPKIKDNQVVVNSVLEHIPHEIDPVGAQSLIFDLQFAQLMPDGTLKKTDRKDPKQQLDALDTYRYYCNSNHGKKIMKYIKDYNPEDFVDDEDDGY